MPAFAVRIQSWLSSPRIVWVAALLAIATGASGLRLGFLIDDRVMLLALLARLFGVPLPGAWWDMYRVFPNDALGEAIELGYLPWWTSPQLSVAFLRPLPLLTHYFDMALWPDKPALMHAHGMAWYALLAVLVTRMYRQLLGPTAIAGAGAIMFALDDAHAASAAWISSRNTVITAVFVVAAFASHDRARRAGSRVHAWLGPAFALLAFLSSESALALWAFLGAHALFLDRGQLGARARSLAPFAVVTAAWIAGYALGGYGSRGSGHYLDPRSASFAAELPERFSQNLSELLLLPQSLVDVLPVGRANAARGAIAALGLALAFGTALCVRARPLLRFSVAATLLALVPACAAVPTPRLLLLPSVTAFLWIGELCSVLLASSCARRWHAPGALAIAVLVVHGPFAAWYAPRSARVMFGFDQAVIRTSRSLLAGTDPKHSLFVLNTPHYFATRLAAGYREGRPVPGFLYILGASERPVQVTRVASNAITLEPEGGYLHEHWSQLIRDPRERFEAGTRVAVARGSVQVLSVTADGRPARIRVEQPELGAPAAIWSAWDPDRGAYVRVQLPAIGRRITLASRPSRPTPFAL